MRGEVIGLIGWVVLVSPGCATKEAPVSDDSKLEAKQEPAVPAVKRAQFGEVMVRRTGCFGTCPVYTAYVDTSGHVYVHGREHAEFSGLRTGTVDPYAVHALIGAAIDDGYFDTDATYRRGVTDAATIYTSVIADERHHAVSNYAGAAPIVVSNLENAMNDVLSKTEWDEQPTAGGPEDACRSLGSAIEARCEGLLAGVAPSDDCLHWLRQWGGQGLGAFEDDHLQARCDRLHRSMKKVTKPAATARIDPKTLGPHCRIYLSEGLSTCRRALEDGRGMRGVCYDIDSVHEILQLLVGGDEDQGARRSASELRCESLGRRPLR